MQSAASCRQAVAITRQLPLMPAFVVHEMRARSKSIACILDTPELSLRDTPMLAPKPAATSSARRRVMLIIDRNSRMDVPSAILIMARAWSADQPSCSPELARTMAGCRIGDDAPFAETACARFGLPLGPDPGVPPCMRQRFLPCTTGERQAPLERVLAPQRGLASIGPVLRAWSLMPVLPAWRRRKRTLAERLRSRLINPSNECGDHTDRIPLDGSSLKAPQSRRDGNPAGVACLPVIDNRLPGC